MNLDIYVRLLVLKKYYIKSIVDFYNLEFM